ncbi:MAG: hypothetical protein UHS51_03085 [Atopobiaceae bacterium]|nr:hypothetical protein [Atopobiaceae bacterium]
MAKKDIKDTAYTNLLMLADLGIPEAVRFRDALGLEGNPLQSLARVPFASKIPLCVSTISEILYQRTNDLIDQEHNPTILDLACGYSSRVLVMAPRGYTYIGADLPVVAEELIAKRSLLIPDSPNLFAGYRCVDVTDDVQMQKVLAGLRERITIVTQGLLTYLTLDQKQDLMKGVWSLLERDGGCWIIPDACPDRMLPATFDAIMGKVGSTMVQGIYRVVDKQVGRSREENGWQSIDEMTDALEGFGFSVKRVPLYRRELPLWCLDRLDSKAADKLIVAWQSMSSLVVTLPE